MSNIFLMAKNESFALSNEKPKSDIFYNVDINNKTYSFHFAWNSHKEYFSLTIKDDDGNVKEQLLPYLGENYLIRNFDEESDFFRDALIDITRDSDSVRALTQSDFDGETAVILSLGAHLPNADLEDTGFELVTV